MAKTSAVLMCLVLTLAAVAAFGYGEFTRFADLELAESRHKGHTGYGGGHGAAYGGGSYSGGHKGHHKGHKGGHKHKGHKNKGGSYGGAHYAGGAY